MLSNDTINSICKGIELATATAMAKDFPQLTKDQIDSFAGKVFLDVKLHIVAAQLSGKIS